MSAAARRWLPVALLLAAIVAVYATGLQRELSLAGLQRHREALQGFVAARPLLAPVAFVALYVTATALSLPGALFLTLSGGFLFGTWLGGMLSVIGATAGAVALFLIARTSFGAVLRARAGPWLHRLETGLRRDAFSYLLVLRLVPLLPFWLVNLVSAVLDVPLGVFALATLLGIIPGALVYAGVGNGLGAVLDRGEEPDLSLILEPQVILPLLGLAAVAMVPVLYRRRQQRTS
jgi:uncharacterized membrane protein YdjX (TVP38/TMEM64 family)